MNTKNDKQSDWAKRDIGALWKKEGQSQKYLSGYVKVDELGIEKELKIVVFSNKNKNNNEKAPDYRIYVSKPLEITKTSSTPVVAKKVVASVKKTKEVIEESDESLL
jgi:uncharacterized protein (DUF736 family)